jgi:polar amino acid transport system substrate-binding protein
MKQLRISAIAAGLLAAATTGASADVLTDVRSGGKLVCGVLGVNEPFAYQNVETRELVGYEIDLCHMLADHLGVEGETKVVTAQSRIPELTQRRVDVLISLLSYTEERAEQVDFANNYLASAWRCMVRADSGYQHLDELADKRVAILKGSVLEASFRELYPDATILSLDDTSASLLAVFQGKVEATCNNQVTVRLVAIRSGDAESTRLLPEPVMTATTGMAVKKGETTFVEAINGFLDAIEANGAGDAVFDKWLGSDSALLLTREFRFGEPNRPLAITK